MGRPRFKPTDEQRIQVASGKAAGKSNDDLANALQIARGTLELHFADELQHGASKYRLNMIAAMYKAGIEGNVTAMKAFLALGDAANAAMTPDGKKAQANEAAKTAQVGTEWADLLPARVQ